MEVHVVGNGAAARNADVRRDERTASAARHQIAVEHACAPDTPPSALAARPADDDLGGSRSIEEALERRERRRERAVDKVARVKSHRLGAAADGHLGCVGMRHQRGQPQHERRGGAIPREHQRSASTGDAHVARRVGRSNLLNAQQRASIHALQRAQPRKPFVKRVAARYHDAREAARRFCQERAPRSPQASGMWVSR